MKKIILLSALFLISVFAVAQIAYADNPVLSVSPASLDSTVGAPFNVSVQVNPENNKVCVVEGTLNFNNLSCQSITLASGVMAQASPTCASPKFVLGIPKCATAPQNLFSVTVSGIKVGQANLSFAGGKVAGVGVYIPSDFNSGAYNIVAIKKTLPSTLPTTSSPTTKNTATQPAQQAIQQSATPTQQQSQGVPISEQQAALSAGSSSKTIMIIIIILLIIIIICLLWYIFDKRKKK